ncbi:TPA: hypothetical protein ACGO1T_001767 [Streptococcus suis]
MNEIIAVELIKAVEWDGSEKSFEAIVKTCPSHYEITVKDGYLAIINHLCKSEQQADLGDFVTVEDVEMSVIPRNTVGRWKRLPRRNRN